MRVLLVVFLGFALLAPAGPAVAAPKAELWSRWLAHDPASAESVDHAPWSAFLERHLRRQPDGSTRLAYGEVDAGNRQALASYLARLAAVPVSRLSRLEQRAYWINLYNALTVQVVLDAYPVASIRDVNISPGLFTRGPWGKKLVGVEGEAVSLDDIEHRILRPIFADPRLHYALNCASIGCPDLAQSAYTAATTDAMLDTAARAFVNHPRGARIAQGKLRVSSIYAWFKADFGADDEGVLRHLATYAAPALAEALMSIRKIDDHDYDWALNDAGRTAR